MNEPSYTQKAAAPLEEKNQACHVGTAGLALSDSRVFAHPGNS